MKFDNYVAVSDMFLDSSIVDMTYECGIGGLYCFGCKESWSTTNVLRSDIKCNDIPDEIRRSFGRNLTVSEFNNIKEKIGTWNKDIKVVPGLKFGKPSILCKSKMKDLEFDFFRNIYTNNIDIVYFFRNRYNIDFDISKCIVDGCESDVFIFNSRIFGNCIKNIREICDICGRFEIKIKDIVLEKSNIPENVYLFRNIEFPGSLIINREILREFEIFYGRKIECLEIPCY